ncbi:hypothetical protein [Streptomyces sp. NPDC055287]
MTTHAGTRTSVRQQHGSRRYGLYAVRQHIRTRQPHVSTGTARTCAQLRDVHRDAY